MSLFMSERFSTDKSKKNFCPGHFKTCFRINAVPKLNLKKREKISITIFQRENTVVRKSAIGGDFVRKWISSGWFKSIIDCWISI